ncbi:hypothetical protein ACFSJY_18500 [Thalassotalea euphylliae]|uniref:hypothetical protein n=1 Tax=Thalassotalea euphylliae TaxID=1655234 RepID=UPI00363FCA7A
MQKKLFLLFFLSTCCAAFHAVGQDKEYLVGVEDVSYYPLFDFESENVNKPSFARDLLASFFEKNNYKYKFVALPVKRFDKWYIEHNIDFKFPDNFRWREDHTNKLGIHFSEPIIQLTAGTYVLKNNEAYTRNNVTRLATIRGFHPTLWLTEVRAGKLQIVEESSPVSVVKHVIAGNAEATNIDKNVIRHSLQKLSSNEQLVLAENIYNQRYYYHFSSIRYPEVIEKFNVFLRDNQNLIQSLKKKYQIEE